MACILVAGLPASGKSTLAAALSKELGFPMFSKDSMKELLYDSVGFQCRAEKVALGVGAMDILYYCAGQVLSLGQSVILENNFENASKPGLQALLEKYACSVVTVMLTGDPHAIYRRFLERDMSPGRHRGHVVNTCYPEPLGERPPYVPLTFEQFVEGFRARGMDAFDVGGPRVTVDVTDFSRVDIKAIAEEVISLL